MYFYCNKKDGKAAMYSEEKIKAPNFDEYKLTVDKETKDKLKSNEHDIIIKDKKLMLKLNEQGEYNKNKK